jgi:hypothetical protein
MATPTYVSHITQAGGFDWGYLQWLRQILTVKICAV